MRRESHAKRYAIAGIPTAAWTRSIEQHLDAQLDPLWLSFAADCCFPAIRSAKTANAVGMTQLAVSGAQFQPNLSGSKLTCVSTVLNFHRHSQ